MREEPAESRALAVLVPGTRSTGSGRIGGEFPAIPESAT